MDPAETIRVLIVDDQPVMRQGLRTVLEADPEVVVVGEAGSGSEARQLVAETRPAVVLLDIQMPGENGLQVARWLNTHHPAVNVAMLSNYDEEPLIVEAISAGASAYLLKDCSRSLLQHTVHAVVDGAVLFEEELLRRAMRRVVRADPQAALRAASLTERERDILREMAVGKSNREIAGALFVSESTVKKYVQAILAKLAAGNRTEAVAKVAEGGLLSEA